MTFNQGKRHISHFAGYTLVEISVVIAIVAIMAVGVSLSLSTTRSSTRADAVQAELVSQIRLAQTYALQGKMQGGAVPCGYGVAFDANNKDYYLYSISTSDCEATNSDETQTSYFKRGSNSTDLSTQTLSYGCQLNRASNPVTNYEAYFTLPHAKIFSQNGAALSSLITIPIRCNGVDRTITVTPGGMVNAD